MVNIGEYETDSNGRITSLYLDGYDYDEEGDDLDMPAFNLPPIIERLQKLKAITMVNCRLNPIELDNSHFSKNFALLLVQRKSCTRKCMFSLRDKIYAQ